MQHLSRYVLRRGVEREEPDKSGNLLRLAVASERDAREDLLFDVLAQHARHVAGNEAGRDGVALDVASCILARHRLGESDDSSLGGGVVRLSGVTGDTHDAGDVDDASARASHDLARSLRGEEDARQVGVDHLLPLLGLHAHHEVVARDSGVVDEHVDASECGLGLLEKAVDVLLRVRVCVGGWLA